MDPELVEIFEMEAEAFLNGLSDDRCPQSDLYISGIYLDKISGPSPLDPEAAIAKPKRTKK